MMRFKGCLPLISLGFDFIVATFKVNLGKHPKTC
jgi:hypothetical protein